MPTDALRFPSTDPTPIFEHFRGAYATELLTAAVCHFNLFGRLASKPLSRAELARDLGLADRPTVVLTTALAAMGLLQGDPLTLTDLAREHLLPGGMFDVGAYVGLAAQNPGVLAMVESLRSNRPFQGEAGAAYIYREGVRSAMDAADSARHFTLALAGRAKNIAPALARTVNLSENKVLLDVGGGSGIYAIGFLQRFPHLRAIVFDRAEVLKVAREMAAEYGVADRLECVAGDMFQDPFPDADVVLFSNILHDWDVPECRTLVGRAAGRTVMVHDVFLNDDLSGPLPHALYSAALMFLTEGRLYTAADVGGWMRDIGLVPGPVRPTGIHCAVIVGRK